MLTKFISDNLYEILISYLAKVFCLVFGLIILFEGLGWGSTIYAIIGAVLTLIGIFLKKGAFRNVIEKK